MSVFLYRTGEQKKTKKSISKEGLVKSPLQIPAQPYDSFEKKFFLYRELKMPLWKTPPGSRDFMLFCRQFAALTGAGIPFFNSLKLLGELTEHRTLREKIKDVASRVEDGYSPADSFKVNGDVFPVLLINMVEAGEAGGFLNNAMERLALYFEKQYELEQKIRSATVYPKFLVCAILATVVIMLSFVLPVFEGIFSNMGLKMPALTRLLINTGNILYYFWYIIVIIVFAAFCFSRIFLKTKRGRRFYDRLRLNNPVFGPIYRKIVDARFCRTLGTLLDGGTAMLPSLELVKKVTENSIYAENIDKTRDKIIQGESLAEALAAAYFFPPLVIEMCSVGEQTGNLKGMLISAADIFESEVSHIIERLGSLLEPVLLLCMAGIIVLIALSVLLPMFEVYQMI